MRYRWLVGLLALGACVPPTPLGVYRMPLPDGSGGIELRTIIARIESDELVLRDARLDEEFARGESEFAWDGQPMPFHFDEPKGDPLTLYVRDAVLEDTKARPYTTIPISPLIASVDSVSLATLVSGEVRRDFFTVDSWVFADAAEPQPALDAVPGPLEIMNSPSGLGFVISGKLDSVETEWRDAMRSAVPSDPRRAIPCGAPLESTYRSKPAQVVDVPAGTWSTVFVTEIIDSCRTAVPAGVFVFRIERWFAPGVGPVKMAYTASDGRRREYRLIETNVAGVGASLWPLVVGNRWVYRVYGPDGAVVQDRAEVTVESRVDRKFPE